MNTPVARKSLGQHFLHQKNVIHSIIRQFAPDPADAVIEIGPGLGALTFELIPLVGRLHAIELDRVLAEKLQNDTAGEVHVHVHYADALEVNVCDLCPGDAVRMIGNLPYNISTPLLFHLLGSRTCIRDMWFMLQKEVGERIVSEPGTKRYGRLSVMIQQCCSAELVLRVASGAFSPPPKVESVVVRLVPYDIPPYPVEDYGAFDRVVRAAFSQRRKTLRNALRKLVDADRINEAGIDPSVRAEQLGVSDYVKLSKLL
jgi:16S rRNA (adenine1518-N6/adenine1519-N6)-dimethyltransferase